MVRLFKCTSCGRKAVYDRRYAGTLLCDRCSIESVERRFRQAVRRYKLVGAGERIAVALSGGKDSTVALHLLAEYCKNRGNELVAISIDEGIKGYRNHSLRLARKNTERLGLEHVTVSFREAFGATLDEIVRTAKRRRTGLNPCTYCGVARRSLLNRAARELGADKLATGHNLDDETQEIIMNYLRADFVRLYRLGPIYSGREGFVPRIKPLREIPEKETTLYALLRELEFYLSSCPYIGGIHSEIRDFLNRLEANHPNLKFKILRMFDRLKPNLSLGGAEFELRACKICGEPTPKEICKLCELLEGVGLEQQRKKLISA